MGITKSVEHEYVGRLDRICDLCGLPDRAAVHVWPKAQSEEEPVEAGEVLIRVTSGDSEVEVRVTYDPDEVDEMIGDGQVVAVARTQNQRRALDRAHRMMSSGVDR